MWACYQGTDWKNRARAHRILGDAENHLVLWVHVISCGRSQANWLHSSHPHDMLALAQDDRYASHRSDCFCNISVSAFDGFLAGIGHGDCKPRFHRSLRLRYVLLSIIGGAAYAFVVLHPLTGIERPWRKVRTWYHMGEYRRKSGI